MNDANPCGMRGIDFVEFAADDPSALRATFRAFGFRRARNDARGAGRGTEYWTQNDIHLVLSSTPGSFADRFQQLHGPSIASLGFRVDDARSAFAAAVARGARPFEGPGATFDAPAIYGIGDSLVYLVDRWAERGTLFDALPATDEPAGPGFGFLTIDHLTNNVDKGTLERWSGFYRDIFGFTEVRSFDIRGEKTGLYSYALRSPDGSFCIPINEGTEEKSQIEEYLREYRGPGVQHIAFLSDDLLASLDHMAGGAVDFLDIDDDYYEAAFERVPNVREDPGRIRRHQVLVDGDDDGYLLQIFTRNLCGPIFVELIQRNDHHSFGEGNFGALFRSIERDQERRGVL